MTETSSARSEPDLLDPGAQSPMAANMFRDLELFLTETGMPDTELCRRAGIKAEALRNLRSGMPVSSTIAERMRAWLTENGCRITVITMEGRLMRTTRILPGKPEVREQIAKEMRAIAERSVARARVQRGPDPARERQQILRDIDTLDQRIAQLMDRRNALLARLGPGEVQ